MRSADGCAATPRHSKHSHAALPSIHFRFILFGLIIALGHASNIAAEQTSDAAPSQHHRAPAFDFPTVYFQRNSFQLDKKAQASLAPLVNQLKNHPDLQIRLVGHVDERHTSAYGLAVAGKRADALRTFLRAHGIQNRITIQAVGKEDPVCFERTDACYRMSNQVNVLRSESAREIS